MTINYTALTSLTNASANTAASMFMDQIKAMVTANPAWTVVDDTAAIGSGAYRYLCFKNAAAQSGLPNDYYVLFTCTGSTITVWLGETYNAATHVLSNCAPSLSTTSYPISASGQLASPPTVTPHGTTGAPTTSGTIIPHQINVNPGTTTIYYQCAVYPEHLYLGTGSTNALTTASIYAGGYEVLTVGGETYPICLGDCKTTSTASPGFQTTREIPQYFSTSKSYFGQLSPWTGGNSAYVEYSRATVGVNAADVAQGNTYPTSPYMAMGNTGASSSLYNTRGRFRNMLCSVSFPTSMVVGDTVQIGTTYWALITAGGNYHYIDTGVAAP